ncbi:MAG: phage tail protein, partial [bacterium]|nr:phage tail protein [bacterium]
MEANNINIKPFTSKGEIGICSGNITQTISATNNKAQQYAEQAKKYRDEALEYKNITLTYATENSDVTYEYITSVKNELENEINTKQDIGNYALLTDIPNSISELTNDSLYVNQTELQTALGSLKVLPPQTGHAMKYLTTDGTNASWETIPNGMYIGAIFPVIASASYVPDGALPCDGTEYSKSQFNDLWTNYLTADTPLLNTCSYADYASDITMYGSCIKFGIDTVNNKFKVPTIKDGQYITQALSNEELGKSYNESLPNIKGTWDCDGLTDVTFGQNVQATGALYNHATTLGHQANSFGGGKPAGIGFDASNYSSIYQDNAPVQGNNVRLRYFVQVATGSINQSMMDWAQWASSLSGKLNTDHTNDTKPYLKATYVSGQSGYNIWSNGYCEQWGVQSNLDSSGTGQRTITLLKTYSSTDYVILVHWKNAATQNPSTGWTGSVKTQNADSFVINKDNKTYITAYYWKTCG